MPPAGLLRGWPGPARGEEGLWHPQGLFPVHTTFPRTHPSRHPQLQAYQPKRALQPHKYAPLLPRLGISIGTDGGNATAPPPPRTAGGTKKAPADQQVVTTTIAFGSQVVACKEWQPDSLSWDWPASPTEYGERCGISACGPQALKPPQPASPDNAPPHPAPAPAGASGSSQPPAAQVRKLAALVCSDPEAAGAQLLSAVEGGGAAAQAAVFALFQADCPDDAAASDAYGAAIDAKNDGDPAHLEDTAA